MENIPFLQILVGVGATLVLAFVFFFQIPAWRLYLALRRVKRELSALGESARSANTLVEPATVLERAMAAEPFRHLWTEYTDTLHAQKALDRGEWVTKNIRSTCPAETFFNTQVLVDTPLRTEFFKHLPGVFTGFGILATFYGLINALHRFQPTGEAAQLQSGVKALLDGVSEAFVFSAIAIGIAMVVTLLEKLAVSRRSRQVEEICQEIDAFYAAGAGEDYLASLVRSAEESATQTKQLKESLVGELKVLLTELTDRQILAHQHQTQSLSKDLVGSIETSLAAPMGRLADAVEVASGNQGQAVHSMLQDLLAAFIAKLDDTFGGQTREINDLLQSTTAAMRAMQSDFAQMVSALSSAGSSAGNAMGEQLSKALASAEARQAEMNRQMETFVTQIRDLVAQTQSESASKLQGLLGDLHVSVDALVANMAEQQARLGAANTAASTQLATSAQGAIAGISGQVEALIANNLDATRQMSEAVNRLSTVSTSTVDKMNKGAEDMYLAASEFKEAGRAVTGTFDKAGALSEKLSTSAATLESSTRALEAVVGEYDKTRNSLAPMLASLQAIVDTAKRDASLSSKLVSDMEAALKQFADAQDQAAQYLDRVSDVLERAFQDFHTALTDVLKKTMHQIDEPLSQAVNALSVVIEELAETQAALPSKRH